MTPAQIRNCLTFLARADLKGAEVPAYAEVVNALQTDLRAAEQPPEPKKPAQPPEG